MYPDLYIVAYKAEVGVSEEELIDRAKLYLKQNDVQIVCANWVGEPEKGFEAQQNEIFLIRSDSPPTFLKNTKDEIGIKIAELITDDFSK